MGDLVAAERAQICRVCVLGMLGSPGCGLGAVTVLVTRPYPAGRASPGYAVIESWHSIVEFELRRVRCFATRGAGPGLGRRLARGVQHRPAAPGLRDGALGGLRAGRRRAGGSVGMSRAWPGLARAAGSPRRAGWTR